MEAFAEVWASTGIANLSSAGQLVMIPVCLLLLYLGIRRGFEPLLLVPIGFGGLLANVPGVDIAGPEGFLGIVYASGIANGLFPLLIFIGVGALTDFGPLLAHPKTALLGAAAQFGIFSTLLGALALSSFVEGIEFDLGDAAAIGIIGGADGPTAIFLASRLSPDLLGAIAVAAYSYMALVPIIQPPIMRALTTKKERQIKMEQLRPVSKKEKIIFPIVVTIFVSLLLPAAAPLIGMLMLGNLFRESLVVDRLNKTAQNELINIVTIFLGVTVGATATGKTFLGFISDMFAAASFGEAMHYFLTSAVGILILGLVAFACGTGGGVLLGKLMCKLTKGRVNPLIGSAGVSAVPMAARVSQKVGQEEDSSNYLLMHAMGPNVAGVIGSAVAAGVLLSLFG